MPKITQAIMANSTLHRQVLGNLIIFLGNERINYGEQRVVMACSGKSDDFPMNMYFLNSVGISYKHGVFQFMMCRETILLFSMELISN